MFLPDGSRAFVSLENAGAVAVVDSTAHTFMRLIELGGRRRGPKARPMGLAVRSDGTARHARGDEAQVSRSLTAVAEAGTIGRR